MLKLPLVNFAQISVYLAWPVFIWLIIMNLLFTPATVERWHSHNGNPLNQNEKTLNKAVFNYLKNDQALPSQFGLREKIHLKDVSVLFKMAFFVRNLTLFLLLLAFFILTKQKQLWLFWQAIKASGLIFALGQLILLALAWLSFAGFFNTFHRLFFAPKSWLFPSSSILIKLYPFTFWSQAALLWFALTSLFLLAVSLLLTITGGKGTNINGD